MGKLSPFVDMTGKMDQVALNDQNIQRLMTELNRASDQLDEINQGLVIINKGQIPAPLVGNQYSASVNLGTAAPSSFLAFMTRSDQAGNFFAMPYFNTAGFPISAINMAAYASLQPGVAGGNPTLNFTALVSNAYLGSAPPSVTFYYYAFNQPANPSGS